MSTIGYKFSWDITDELEIGKDGIVNAPMVTHNSNTEDQPTLAELFPKCSPAHIEVKQRISETVMIISGQNFTKMHSEKKLEFLAELTFLTSLDAELTVRSL